MNNEVETVKKRGRFTWILIAILCWITSIYSPDIGLRGVLLGLGMYFNVVFIENYISKRKYDCFVVRLISAVVFVLPCVGVTLLLLNHYLPKDLNGTKTVLLSSPVVYGVMFYLGVYVSEKLKCPNWLAFMIIMLFMYGAGVFRLSGLLQYPDLYLFAAISAFGLVSMITCIVCGGLFLRTQNVTVFSGFMLVVFVIGFFCNCNYGMSYRRVVFEADKHHPEILKNLDYALAITGNEWSNGNSIHFVFNKDGLKIDNLEAKNDSIYTRNTKLKVAKLIYTKEDDFAIDSELTLKFVRESNKIYLEKGKDKKKILIANGYSPSYAEEIKRIFYIKDGKVYSRNLLGDDEVFYCEVDQPRKTWRSFSYVTPDGKFLLYNGPHVSPIQDTLLSAVVELSSGKSHLIPHEYWRRASRWRPKVWLSNKLLTGK